MTKVVKLKVSAMDKLAEVFRKGMQPWSHSGTYTPFRVKKVVKRKKL